MADGPALRALIGFPFGARTGGSEAILLTLLRHREHAGLDPHVWFGEDGPFREEVASLGVPTSVASPHGWRPRGVLAAIRATVAAVRRERPDVLVSWLPRVQTVTGPSAIVTRMTRHTVCWQHIVPTGNRRHALAFLLPHAAVIADSEAGAVAQRRMRPRRPVHTIWPGIDDPPRLLEGERDRLRHELGLRDDTPVVAIAGRLIAWKGQERLLEAIALLRDDGLDSQLLVVGGEDPHERDGTASRLRERSAALGLEDRVTLTGSVPDARPHMQLADVLVNASTPEPFGIVLLEAMALEVPLVAVAEGGPLEIVESGRSGLLVPTGTPADLADGVGALLRDQDLRRRLVAGGRERYESRFSAEQFAREAGAALRAVAAGRPPGSRG